MPGNMRTAPTVHWVFTGYRTHAEGNTDTTHLTLGVPTHKSPSVGEVGKQITATSIQRVSQSTEGSALVYLKKERKRERKKERRRKKREKSLEKKKKKVQKKDKKRKGKKEREVSKEGSKSEPVRSTRVKRLHVHCLQALALHRNSFCYLAPPILALAHACKASP